MAIPTATGWNRPAACLLDEEIQGEYLINTSTQADVLDTHQDDVSTLQGYESCEEELGGSVFETLDAIADKSMDIMDTVWKLRELIRKSMKTKDNSLQEALKIADQVMDSPAKPTELWAAKNLMQMRTHKSDNV